MKWRGWGGCPDPFTLSPVEADARVLLLSLAPHHRCAFVNDPLSFLSAGLFPPFSSNKIHYSASL